MQHYLSTNSLFVPCNWPVGNKGSKNFPYSTQKRFNHYVKYKTSEKQGLQVESKLLSICSEKQVNNSHSCFSGNLPFKKFYKIGKYVYCLPQYLFTQRSIQFYDLVSFDKSVYVFSCCNRMENFFTCMLLLYSCMGMQ